MLFRNGSLAQYIVDDMRRLDAGELLIQTLVLENKFFMVDAQLTENGGVKVADVDRVLDDVVGHLVGLAIDKSGLHAAAGHPDAETAGMMVAAIIFLGELALAINGAAKFTAPNHQRVLEQAALLEVLDEAVAALVNVLALRRKVARQVAMLVPAAMKDLHEAHAALDQPPGHQRGVGESAPLFGLGTIELVSLFGFARKVG